MALDLDAIEARANAATPDWAVDVEIDGTMAGRHTVVRAASDPYQRRVFTVGQTRLHDTARAEANAEFAAHARQDVPALVAEVRRLRAVVERLARAV